MLHKVCCSVAQRVLGSFDVTSLSPSFFSLSLFPAVTEAGKIGDPLSRNFFKEEYKLNYKIGTFPKPFVAVVDGITMGGVGTCY